MYTLGCCVEKHRCHSCGAHGNGKTLLAQVLPCGMTKTFVKLRSLPETSIFNAASVKRFYISQRRTDKKLPSCMFPPTHKQFGCRSCGSSKVGCLGLPHSVPWWPVALATLSAQTRYFESGKVTISSSFSVLSWFNAKVRGSCRGEAESAAWSSCCKWDLQLIVVMVMLVRWPKCWGARRLLTPLQTHIRAAGLQGDGILAAPGAPFLESNRRRRPINSTTFPKAFQVAWTQPGYLSISHTALK